MSCELSEDTTAALKAAVEKVLMTGKVVDVRLREEEDKFYADPRGFASTVETLTAELSGGRVRAKLDDICPCFLLGPVKEGPEGPAE